MKIENESAAQKEFKKCVGIAADHGGYELKVQLISILQNRGYTIIDFGSHHFDADDDFPDFVIPLAKSVVRKVVYRGIAICGSGVGACVVANKVPGVRAALITDLFSAHQGVEDDDMNVMCLGGKLSGYNFALELSLIFLNSRFKEEERFIRRIAKITSLERDDKYNFELHTLDEVDYQKSEI